MSLTNIAMCGGLNFQELHQGYLGVIRLLRILSNFILDRRMMDTHGYVGGCFS
jgi:hypothetical protein